MKYCIGIGNPGEQYASTRHNAGKMYIASLETYLKERDILTKYKLLSSDEFMNSSGIYVKRIVNYFKVAPDDLIIAHDDLDLDLGAYKIQKGVGPKVHNGLTSIEKELGTTDFWRIRIGIDGRDPQKREEGETYVLSPFGKDETALLTEVFSEIHTQLTKTFL